MLRYVIFIPNLLRVFFYQEWVFVLNGFSILTEMCVCVCVCVCMLSHVQLFAVPWTVACQAHLPMKFSRQEYWSGVLVSTAGDLLTQGLTLCLLCLLHWQEDSQEKGMATHSNILAWRVPWADEPGRLQSMGLQIVGHN